jgi:hypothetical protein
MLRIFILFSVCILHTIASWCQEVSVTAYDVKCNGGNDGEVSISISKSSGEYMLRILFSSNNRLVSQESLNSDTSLVFYDLRASNYTLQIISEVGIIEKLFSVNEPKELKANIIQIINNPSNETNCSGVIEAQPTGGTAPYSFEWSENTKKMNTQEVSELCPGIYRCIINDANNCGPVSATAYLLIEE